MVLLQSVFLWAASSFIIFSLRKNGFNVNDCERNKIDWVSLSFHFLLLNSVAIIKCVCMHRTNENGRRLKKRGEIEEYENVHGRKNTSQVNGIKRIDSQKTNYSENQKLSIQSSFFPSFRSIQKDKERSYSGWERDCERLKAWAWTTINNENCASLCACVSVYIKRNIKVFGCVFLGWYGIWPQTFM